jgi:hypothetical protein
MADETPLHCDRPFSPDDPDLRASGLTMAKVVIATDPVESIKVGWIDPVKTLISTLNIVWSDNGKEHCLVL